MWTKIFLIFSCLLLLVNCPPVRVETTPPTNQTVETATKNVRDGLTVLGEGIRNLDPAGLNRLLNENTDLRQKLENITKSLNAAAGLGMIEIANRAVQIRVRSYTGAFTVTAWVDRRENMFWLNRTLNNKGFAFGDETAHINAIHLQSLRTTPGGQGDAWDHMARNALAYTRGLFLKYLGDNTILPGDFESIDLNTSFGGISGQHKIFLEVTPTAKDTSGGWAIRFQTILKRENDQIEVVRDYDFVSNKYPGHVLNQALPPVEQIVILKIASPATSSPPAPSGPTS
jgi:hypothetical protein